MSRKSKRGQFVRCIRTCRDGTRCGKLAPADTQVCFVHARAVQPGIAQPAPLDELEILRKLARDTDPRVRLRAVDLLMSHKATTTATPSTLWDDLVARATDDQRERLCDLVNQLRALKAEMQGIPPPSAPAPDEDEDAPVQAVAPTPPSTWGPTRVPDPMPVEDDVLAPPPSTHGDSPTSEAASETSCMPLDQQRRAEATKAYWATYGEHQRRRR